MAVLSVRAVVSIGGASVVQVFIDWAAIIPITQRSYPVLWGRNSALLHAVYV